MRLQPDETPVVNPLNVAIVLDGPIVPAWVAKTIVEARNAPFVGRLGFIFLSPDGKVPEKSSALFRRYLRRFAAVLTTEDDPLKPIDLSSDSANEAIQKAGLSVDDWDVVLWLSRQELGAPPAYSGRYGVLHYRHAFQHPGPAAGEYFWELYHQAPVSGAVLELIPPSGPPTTLVASFSATEIGWSLRRNRLVPYWKAIAVIEKALRELSRKRDNYRPLGNHQEHKGTPLPTNAQMAKFVLTHATRTIKRRLLYSHQEAYWFIAFRTNNQNFVAAREAFDPTGFQEVVAPADHFYADPFIHKWNGRNYLFFEDYLYAERKGVISVVEMGVAGPVGDVVRILDLPYHLSYPFVFEQDGQLFMIPETLGSGRVELYTANVPTGPWRMEKILQDDLKAADTTLWIDDGVYYFLTSVAENFVTPNDHLHIFYSTSLTGEWRAHPQNPVCSDVRNSRSAGKLFRQNGRLIRPAQDCSVRYGYACQLNEVETMTPDSFRERMVNRIEPSWLPGMIGTHTLNANQDIEVIDGQVLRSRYSEEGESSIARLQSSWRRRSAAGSLRRLGPASITISSRI